MPQLPLENALVALGVQARALGYSRDSFEQPVVRKFSGIVSRGRVEAFGTGLLVPIAFGVGESRNGVD